MHVAKGGGKGVAIIKNSSAALCGACHTRGSDDTKIIAKGGFIKHHEQYPEFLNSPHKENLTCVSCHDPHKAVHKGQTNPTEGAGIKTQCTVCHAEEGMEFSESTAHATVRCTDCHLPMATKSALSLGKFKGDVKTHLFKINTDPNANMFTDDGKFAKGYVSLDFACLSCHSDKDKEWAAKYAKADIHKLV